MPAPLQPIRLILLWLLVPPSVCVCPPGFYLSFEHQQSCQPCPECAAPYTRLSPCGPGPAQGTCGGGLQLELSIVGVSSVNLTVALTNYSGRADPPVDATALNVALKPCPTPEEYRSLADLQCHPCQICRPPVPVEAAPCVTEHDRLCIPPVTVMLQANGSNLFLNPGLLVELLASLSRNGFNSSYLVRNYDQVYVTRIPCPSDQYRSQVTGECLPCTACPPLTLESTPCTPDADRVCDTSLVAGFLLGNAPFAAQLTGAWNLSLFQLGPDGNALPTTGPACTGQNQFRSSLDGGCHPCSPACKAGETQLRACSPTVGDRICATMVVNTSALAEAGVNVTRLNLGQIKAVVQGAISASQPFPLPADLPISPGNSLQLVVTPRPCSPGAYLNLSGLTCTPCSIHQSYQYIVSSCLPDADAVFATCKRCQQMETVVRECSPLADRVCGGSMGIQVYAANASSLNRTLLVNDLIGRLLDALPVGSSVDPSYLQHWQAVFSVISGAYVGYDVWVDRLQCTPGAQYVDARTQTCRACSACPVSAYYPTSPCTNVSDTACARCTACASGQYEACPCGSVSSLTSPDCLAGQGDRVCYAYVGVNVSVDVALLAQYDAADLNAAYIPAVRASLQAQTLAAVVAVQIISSSLFTDGLTSPNPDGTVDVYYGAPTVKYTLFPIAGILPTPQGVLRHQLAIEFGGLYAQRPNTQGDYTVIVERALRTADVYLVPAGAMDAQNASARRRLLQTSNQTVSCPQDSYLTIYPLLPTPLCVPCQCDPVLSADPSTPPALRWQLAVAPCPTNYARYCPGGTRPPQCLLRFPGTVVISINASNTTRLECPSGQTITTDPATQGVLCVGTPCGPGFTGIPGYCVPCARGTFKSVNGSTPCVACPLNTYAPTPATTGLAGCVPCMNHSTSQAGSANCTCNAGYSGPSCAPCAPGTYKFIPGDAPCAPCEQGGQAPSPASLHCWACPNGTFAAGLGQSACDDCAAGQYQAGTGATACILCLPGLASRPAPPRLDCLDCAAGAYTPDYGRSVCLACPRGAYAPAPRATACATCQNGTTPRLSSQGCVGCPSGSYGLWGVCAPCPAGTYGPDSSATVCVMCPRGLATPSTGASNVFQCAPCDENRYWDPLDGCQPCPSNTVAPRGALSARDCLAAPGYYGLPGQRALVCPAGSYCPQASMAPSKCPTGSQSVQGSQACVLQPTGENTSMVHQFDSIILASWFVVTLLGIGCLARTKRFWRRGL